MRSPEFQLRTVQQTELWRDSEEQARVEMSKGKTCVGRREQGPNQDRVRMGQRGFRNKEARKHAHREHGGTCFVPASSERRCGSFGVPVTK